MAAPAAQAASDAAPVEQAATNLGTVATLQGTSHLWVVGEDGALHWAGDTRGLAGHYVNWASRREVSLSELRATRRGDPWLSAGLVKIGDAIYFPKWEADAPRPTLLHVQSIADVELFGISGANYGALVLDQRAWEQRYGFPVSELARGVLAAATPGGATGSAAVGPRLNGAAPLECGWADVGGHQVYSCVYPGRQAAAWRDPSGTTLLLYLGADGQVQATPAGYAFFGAGTTPPPVAAPAPPVAAPAPTGAFTATITNDFTGYSMGRIFVLDNGQIWEQTEAWVWTWFWSRPQVLIYPTAAGWKLHFDQIDHDVFVRRIR
jgi:hypothetical protein